MSTTTRRCNVAHGETATGAEALLRGRYLAAERLYVDEVDPTRLADVVIGNSTFRRPRILLARS
jgi:uridine kinase